MIDAALAEAHQQGTREGRLEGYREGLGLAEKAAAAREAREQLREAERQHAKATQVASAYIATLLEDPAIVH
jgi:hypothetical protein